MELYTNARAVARGLSNSSQTDESVPERRLDSSFTEYQRHIEASWTFLLCP